MFNKEAYRWHISSFKEIANKIHVDFKLFEKLYNSAPLYTLRSEQVRKIANIKPVKTFKELVSKTQDIEKIISWGLHHNLPAPVVVQYPDKKMYAVLFQDIIYFSNIFSLPLKVVYIEIKPEHLEMKK